MARHVPSQAGNETSEDFETLFVSFTFINIARMGHNVTSGGTQKVEESTVVRRVQDADGHRSDRQGRSLLPHTQKVYEGCRGK
jgi:hypothetical protein